MKNNRTPKLITFAAIFAGLLTIAFMTPNMSASAAAYDGDGDCDKECRKALAQARASTAQYHDVSVALADGFVPASPCVSVPGLGAMGIHYVNFARTGNPNLDVTEPETLLYIPDEDGELHLVGAEYVRFEPTPPAPSLFGQDFHYDTNLNAYTLHVWMWRNNPSGMFAAFNPKLSCPPSAPAFAAK